tara:strand:+ start:3393 stop:3824 length:432 start_codon:yes stop_codon:yes gene_type:complete
MHRLGALAAKLSSKQTLRQGERLFDGAQGRAFLGMIDGEEHWSRRFLDDTELAVAVLAFEQAAFDARQKALPPFLRQPLAVLESDLGVQDDSDAAVVSQAAQLARALRTLHRRRWQELCKQTIQGLHQVSWLRRARSQGLIVQ